MQTSSFYLYSGPGRISIARTAPAHITGFRTYRALAPGAWLFDPKYRADNITYRERYLREVLAPLDPSRVWDELYALAEGHEPVLLCHEHLRKPGETCHRRLVAEWFRQTLGRDVPEKTIMPNVQTAQLSLLGWRTREDSNL